MSKFEFSYTQTDMFGKVEKTYNVSTNQCVLQDVLEDFELFLRGAGFVFDGIVDIVDNEQQPVYLADVGEKPTEQEKSDYFYHGERNK